MTTATVATQILDRLDVVLKTNALTGAQVFRDRTDAQSREETPCFNVVARDDPVEPFSGEMDRHELMVDVRINVRADVPTTLAELHHAAVHAPIVDDPVLRDLCVSVRHMAATFDREEADLTSLIKSVQYRFTYLIPQNTL